VIGAARLLAVHAHPDDESLFTGGTLAHYARNGALVCLVMCTDGARGSRVDEAGACGQLPLGDVRLRELEVACATLGIEDVRRLGFDDSGNVTGEISAHPNAFVNQTDAAVAGLIDVLDECRPHVVITYNRVGVYGHRDHIQASQVTAAAITAAHRNGVTPPRLFHIVLPKRELEQWWLLPMLADEPDPWTGRVPSPTELAETWACDDNEVWASIDIAGVLDAKRCAIAAHRSQGQLLVQRLLSTPESHEHFSLLDPWTGRVQLRTAPADDLFAGL
jgi:N-acetyl-1-D-myo-inositol-2-amino-2-deoxy-alpha-D-glucopyranoside deacetylase